LPPSPFTPLFGVRQFFVSIFLMFWIVSTAQAQSSAPAAAKVTPVIARRELAAVRTTATIRIDGELAEDAWQTAPVATNFVETRPTPGQPERHRTEVRLLYDDAMIYVAAVLHDAASDSILRELTPRDNLANTDFFGVFFDTYDDHLNGYGFFVTPAGVQLDARYSNGGDDNGEDFSWNAVWDSHVSVRGTDWVVEMAIPYSAIRFSAAAVQEWGLNFSRRRQSTRQQFFWNEIHPEVNGFINQFGRLTALADLHPPLRLSLSPYVSGYLNHYPAKDKGVKSTNTSFNGGADIKWGLNESFTLDATLVPDFGQVLSDNVVLNLSPFEVQFNENRPFFLEGVELFNKGGLFYSRRVGAQPIGYSSARDNLRSGERLLRNPNDSRLLNATKLSGRTSRGLGVGIFNGLTRPMSATAIDSLGTERSINTAPLTNYNIIVLDQSLPNNSFVTLINTNVWRRGETYDANVTGGLLRLTNKSNTYAFNGRFTYSRRRGQQFGSSQQIDNPSGLAWRGEVGKISGTWQYSLSAQIESDTYNPNDLGLLFNNNSINPSLNISYNRYKPFDTPLGRVNNLFVWGGGWWQSLYKPRAFQEAGLYLGSNTTFSKTFTTLEINFDYSPTQKRDYFEPRTDPLGQFWLPIPATAALSGWVSTDYRRKWAIDASGSYRGYAQAGRRIAEVGFGPRYRFSNKFSMRHRLDIQRANRQEGYFGGREGSGIVADTLFDGGRVLLGSRTLHTVTNTLSASYIFTNRMSLTFRGRHYTSTARYQSFFELLKNGDRRAVAYDRNRDLTFNALNIDMVFSWWFAPGSEIAIVWKDAIASVRRSEFVTPQYRENFRATLNAPQNNAFSVKVLYFLDYAVVRRRLARG
jgi:hypothetical protein